MSGLTDLIDSMEPAKLQGAVSHLAIVAHGDSPGTVELEHPLTAGSILHFAAAFDRLKTLLTRDSWVTFSTKPARVSPARYSYSALLPSRRSCCMGKHELRSRGEHRRFVRCRM